MMSKLQNPKYHLGKLSSNQNALLQTKMGNNMEYIYKQNIECLRAILLILLMLIVSRSLYAVDWVEVDGLRYKYIRYNGPVTGYGEVYLVGYGSAVPQILKIPSYVKYQKQITKRTCFVSTISSGAFANCSKLISVSTGSVQYIESYAFAGCTSLQKIGFGLCKSIGSKAFSGCSALDTIYYTNAQVATDAFDEYTYENAKLIVPDDYREECNNHEVWSKFQNKVYSYSITLNPTYGSVSYNGEIVNSGDFKTFSALEGSSITLSFSPETGRELANLIINDEDITSKVIDNQHTIENVSKSLYIQVSFFSITISSTGNGHVYCTNRGL